MTTYDTSVCTGELRPIFHIEDEFVAAGWSGTGLMRTDRYCNPTRSIENLHLPSGREIRGNTFVLEWAHQWEDADYED